MSMLLGIMFVTWLIKTLISDVSYAVRGEIPPRTQLKMARIEQAGGAVVRPARYGLGDVVRDLWHDGLEDWRDERAAKRQARKQAQEPDPVAIRPRTGPPPSRLRPGRGDDGQGVSEAPTLETFDQDDERAEDFTASVVHDGTTYSWSCSGCGTKQPGFATQEKAQAAGFAHRCYSERCSACGATQSGLPSTEACRQWRERHVCPTASPEASPAAGEAKPESQPDQAPAAESPSASGDQPDGTTGSQPTAAAGPDPGPDGRPHLRVLPPLPENSDSSGQPEPSPDAGTAPAATEGGNPTMTQASGETTDMQATLHFLEQMQQHINGEVLAKLQLAQATLAGKQVDSETLAFMSRIREQGNAMASLCEQGADHVSSYHGLMREAVNSTPEAADTDWYRNH